MDHKEQAEANIRACRGFVAAFEGVAPPELMRDLLAAVDKHEAAVRRANGLDESTSGETREEWVARMSARTEGK